jgi:hypothetical protein
MVGALIIPRSATRQIRRTPKRVCSRAATGKSVFTSAVLPGHSSQHNGQPSSSSTNPTTICGKSGR